MYQKVAAVMAVVSHRLMIPKARQTLHKQRYKQLRMATCQMKTRRMKAWSRRRLRGVIITQLRLLVTKCSLHTPNTRIAVSANCSSGATGVTMFVRPPRLAITRSGRLAAVLHCPPPSAEWTQEDMENAEPMGPPEISEDDMDGDGAAQKKPTTEK